MQAYLLSLSSSVQCSKAIVSLRAPSPIRQIALFKRRSSILKRVFYCVFNSHITNESTSVNARVEWRSGGRSGCVQLGTVLAPMYEHSLAALLNEGD